MAWVNARALADDAAEEIRRILEYSVLAKSRRERK